MSHIAIVRSSARTAYARMENKEDNTQSRPDTEDMTDHLSQCLVTSLSSSCTGSNLIQEIETSDDVTKETLLRQSQSNLPEISTEADIQAMVREDLSQQNVISHLDNKWSEIVENHQKLIRHLEDCNNRVTHASIQCLEVLDSSIEATCDRVNEQIASFESLISKCDELSLNLKLTEDFREEVKTFRKYVDTLCKFHRLRPIA